MTSCKSDKYPGYFITFEGIDGSGKSTQAKLLHNHLRIVHGRGTSVLVREPGSDEVSEKIRQLIKSSSKSLTNLAAVFLFEAARAQLVQKIIVPALHRGAVVICDRFIDSTLVYQSLPGETSRSTICELNNYATGGLIPDVTFLLSASPDMAIKRLSGRSSANEESFDFLDATQFMHLAQGYEQLASCYPDRIVTFDGDASIDEIHLGICETLYNTQKFNDALRLNPQKEELKMF